MNSRGIFLPSAWTLQHPPICKSDLISSSSQLQGDESLKDQKVLGLNLALCLFTAPYGFVFVFFFCKPICKWA